jgi:acid phosphatase type 7
MSNVLRARRRLDLLQVVLFFVAVLLVVVADAGVTSQYRRKLEATVEMPLDADVFRVPPGYNAPQQVRLIRLRQPIDQVSHASLISFLLSDRRP